MADRAPWGSRSATYETVASPEDAVWIGFDLLEYLVDAAWREIVVAVPAAIAIGPVQVPFVGAGAIAELRDAHLGPFGQVRLPRGTALEDGYRAAADAGFDPDLIAQAGWDPS